MLTNVESLIEKGIDVLVICAQDATAAALSELAALVVPPQSAKDGRLQIPRVL